MTILNVVQFALAPEQLALFVVFNNQHQCKFNYEFLRVYSPSGMENANSPLVTHKKQVKLLRIEPVAQYGYRFIFDDEHSAIYGCEHLFMLYQQKEALWQKYLTAIAQSGHSREASIDIKQL